VIEPANEVLEGWAGSCRARCSVYRPRDVEEAAQALSDAARRGKSVVHRGSGLSYGDAALNEGGVVLDTTHLPRSLELDPHLGVLRAGASATIEAAWKATVSSGWWPAVVPGSMKATLGGCAAMDVHGKNHFRRGTFGEHLESLTLLEPDGATRKVSASDQRGGLPEVLGAQGLTGTILDMTLRLQRIHSGFVEVETWALPTLESALEALEVRGAEADYSVGWVDCGAAAEAAGRSVLAFAVDLPPDHRLGGRGLALTDQLFPDRLLGILPRRWAWQALRPLAWRSGLRAFNAARWASSKVRSGSKTFQTYARFHFLLDLIPEWRRIYRPNGFLQYQMFVPTASAAFALREALRLQREAGLASTVAVLKRHRPGRFAAPYAPDGYSLALDFPIRPRAPTALESLCRSFDGLLGEVGGRVYAAKDAVSRGVLPVNRHPLFSSNLVRRWEGPGNRAAKGLGAG
jgi:FAD/FMN-containing dehydrogenase